MNNYIKPPLIIGLLILGIYYGLVPLFGFEVWIRNSGWKEINFTSSFINIIISIIGLFFVIKKDKKSN